MDTPLGKNPHSDNPDSEGFFDFGHLDEYLNELNPFKDKSDTPLTSALSRLEELITSGQVTDKDFEKVFTEAEEIILTHAPEYPALYLGLASLQIEHSRFVQAEQTMSAYRADHELNHSAWTLIGAAQLGQRKFDLAEQSFQQAIDLQQDAESYYRLAYSQYEQFKLAPAEENFKKSIELGEDDASAYYCLGTSQLGLEKLVEAEANLRKTLERDANHSGALLALGATLTIQGRFSESELYLKQHILIDPEHSYAYVLLGEAQIHQKKFKEAEQNLLVAYRENPLEPRTLLFLGTALLHQRKYASSESLLRKHTAIVPDSESGWHSLALAQFGQKKYARAGSSIRAGGALKNERKLMAGGEALEQNDLLAAERYFTHQVHDEPTDIRGWLYLINTQVALDKEKQVKKTYSLMRKQFPHNVITGMPD